MCVCLKVLSRASPEAKSGVQQLPTRGNGTSPAATVHTLPVCSVLLLPVEKLVLLKHELSQVADVSKYHGSVVGSADVLRDFCGKFCGYF